MSERLAYWIFEWLKVPVTPPDAKDGMAQWRVMRPSDKVYWHRLGVWAGGQLLALLTILIVFRLDWFLEHANIFGIFTFWERGLQIENFFLEQFSVPRGAWLVFGGFVFFVEAAVSLLPLWLRLGHRATWYVVDEQGLRVRSGVLSMQEMRTRFENIQLLTLKQNPWQWWLGLADVEARLAGGGKKEDDLGRSEPSRVIRFENIEDGSAVRDLILAQMRETAGEDVRLAKEEHEQEEDEVLTAVNQFLQEVQAWRGGVEPL